MQSKVTISLPEEVLKTLDTFADTNHQTRSEVIKLAVSDYIRAKALLPEITGQLDVMSHAMNLYAQGGMSLDAFRDIMGTVTMPKA